MKKFFITVFLLSILCSFSGAEEGLDHLKVVGTPKLLKNELVGRYDANDEQCGLIKIVSDMKEMDDFSYNSNLGIVGKVNKNPGEHQIFVSPGEQILRVYATGYKRLDLVFSDYGIRMRSNAVWEVQITGSKSFANLQAELFEVGFDLDQTDVYVSYNFNAPILQKTDRVTYKLPQGTYRFKFEKDGFKTEEIELEVRSDMSRKINLEADSGVKTERKTGILYVDTEPSDSEILVDGQLSNYQTEIVEGVHTIEVRKTLYVPQRAEVEVKPGDVVQQKFTLVPNYGWIEVRAGLPDCQVFLNDKLVGMTDSEGYFKSGKIDVKLFEVRIEKDVYYEPYIEGVSVKNGETHTVEVELEKKFGSLYVDSKPVEGAEVFIDEKRQGVTPFSNEKLLEGSYRVRVSKQPLYKDQERLVTVERGKEVREVFDFEQSLNFANVEIEVRPLEAVVFVDGERAGSGSVGLKLVRGEHLIEVKLDRYKSIEERISVVPGMDRHLEYELEARTGKLTVFVEPKEASSSVIYLNGVESGKSPKIFPELLIGDYEVRVENSRYLPKSERITMREGMEKEIQFRLQTYSGSVQQKASFWRKSKYISLGAFLLSAGASVYFYMDYDSNYSSYEESSVPADIAKYYDNAESSRNNFVLTASVSAAPLVWFIYSWVSESGYESELRK